ncbi:MAG: type II toxin-antitoxin system PemK/MazF family toxin [Nocardioidaceae bacterium]|nr:type II toxin-antitoxin system PemK/MazF family toxin [Nocardioidaceae bacterium]
MNSPLRRGSIVWVDPHPTQGREPAGTRAAVVIASDGYLANVPDLVIVVPVTSTDRNWPHHVLIEGPDVGLPRPSSAMTEQPRTIARSRVTGCAGTADVKTMATIDQWLHDFTDQ